MDELRVDIESLVVDGGTAPDEDAVAAAIRAQAGGVLDGPVLARVSRAVVQSIGAARPWTPGVDPPDRSRSVSEGAAPTGTGSPAGAPG